MGINISNNYNITNYEKFDEALNIINGLDNCGLVSATGLISNGFGLPQQYNEISSGIDNIKIQISKFANGDGPEKLIENYKLGYNEIKNAIIEAYISEYDFAVKNGIITTDVETLKKYGINGTNEFKSILGETLNGMNEKNKKMQYSSLTEFFKDLKNIVDKYSITQDETVEQPIGGNAKPKNNTYIAHRGYRANKLKENSKEAFILAGEMGFWGCEADVRFDKNGVLICSHNAVKNGETPTTFDEFLDICKEFGMTAIIDLKYENGPNNYDYNLSPSILKAIEAKGMQDICVLQTNNAKDISYIRENSKDARIWYLTDSTSNSNIELIKNNNVECVNIFSSDKNAQRIKRLSDEGIDVCVWNVQTEKNKDWLLDFGATYVMTDNSLGSTPYQPGEVDVNNVKNSSTINVSVPSKDLSQITETLTEKNNSINLSTSEENELKKQTQSINATNLSNSTNNNKTYSVTADVIAYAKGGATQGPQAVETWYPLPMGQVVKNMETLYGYKDLEYKIRGDGVRVLSGTAPDGSKFNDLVMVAADVRHETANPNGTFERGEIVETKMGTGIVVDMCELAMIKRQNNQGVHFDISAAWHEEPYSSMVYHNKGNIPLDTNIKNNVVNLNTEKEENATVNNKPNYSIPVKNTTTPNNTNTTNLSSTLQSTSTNVTNLSTNNNKTYSVTADVIAYAKGGATQGPQAVETWYPLPMGQVVKNMENLYGYKDLEYKIRGDGVRVLSGTAPDGTKFNDLVMVAADVRHEVANPNGTFERGEIVETKMGTGIVVDMCELAKIKRQNNEGVHFDISAAWHEEPYSSMVYHNKGNISNDNEEIKL